MPTERWPSVDVSVALITWRKRILTIFNPRWGAFTLPMTKRRAWVARYARQSRREETWEDAAIRAAAEALGRTFSAKAVTGPVLKLDGFTQSDSSGEVKTYHFQVFHVPLDAEIELLSGAVAEWLLPVEFADLDREPISLTARHLVGKLAADGVL